MGNGAKEYQIERHDNPLGDGCYLDSRSGTYIWRGRVGRKTARRAIRHPHSNVVATAATMNKTEAKRIAKEMTVDARRLTGVFAREADAGAEEKGITVAEAWKFYWERDGSKHKSSAQKKAHWEKIIKPTWSGRQLSSITKRDCSTLIENVLKTALDAGEAGTAANNLHKTIKRFFSWCADEGDGATGLECSPMEGKRRKPVKTMHDQRALDERELVWLFQALDHYQRSPMRHVSAAQRARDGQAIEFLLRSMCRRTETLSAPWGWLEDDGLSIPAAATKNGYPLMLPLAPSMRVLIGERPEGAKDDEPIFRASVDWLAHTIEEVRPVMSKLARAEGFNGDFTKSPFHFRLHDFRTTGKTWMQDQRRPDDDEPRFSPETREACLNHREHGVAARYNGALRDPYLLYPQRKRAGEAWNAYLDAVKAKALASEPIAA